MINEITINDKSKVFFEKQIPVHIVVKNGEWSNGYIKEVGSNFLILEEFKKGKIIIFFAEVTSIESYTREIK